ncbi:MAG: hypothetical protein NT022_11985 [Deltaproteobacteria bacterium]|nr:hypothetical protein [Deltaproteobacteria bacterium]
MNTEKALIAEVKSCITAVLNPAASAFPVACRGVSERMGNMIIPCE